MTTNLFKILALGIFLVFAACGGKETYKVNPEYLKTPGLPPAPANPLNDCATIVDNIDRPTRYSCDPGGCIGKCKMYMLDLDNPEAWIEVSPPIRDTSQRHVYLCRCVK